MQNSWLSTVMLRKVVDVLPCRSRPVGASPSSSSRLRLHLLLLLQLLQDPRHHHQLRATRQLVVDVAVIAAQLGGPTATSGQLPARSQVSPFVHAAPGEARRRHVRKELRVRKVIDLRSLFFHNHYSCSSQNNRVTVRIHTMAAAR